MLQTGEMNAKNPTWFRSLKVNLLEICSDQVSELVSGMSQTGTSVSKTCVLKVSLGRDAFALSGDRGNCHLQK